MKINEELLRQVESDLGLNTPFIKGNILKVRNCWHFCTDGNAVDMMFVDREDFVRGMNRIYIVSRKYRVVILAFCLMGTHVHFILYGTFEECNRFMHEYLRRTSMYIAGKYQERHKLDGVPIRHQEVADADYLRTVICYTIKNPPVARIQYNAYDYPWSSGSLYFRFAGEWTSPCWKIETGNKDCLPSMPQWHVKKLLGTKDSLGACPQMIGDIIFPGEYVAYEIVDRLFRTCKSFNYYMCRTREEDVESRGGALSVLSIPMQEMRMNKTAVCMELFGVETVRSLDTAQRVRLARTLKSRYNSSNKQIARLCGLIYSEVKDLL